MIAFIHFLLTSLSRHRWIRVTRCITPIALYTKLDAECHKQATVVGLLLTTLGNGGHAIAASRPPCCIRRWTVSVKMQLLRCFNK